MTGAVAAAMAAAMFVPISSAQAQEPSPSNAAAQTLVPAGTVDVHSILLFPISNQSGSKDNDNVGPLLDDAIRLRLANVNKFRVQRFSRLLPSVQVAYSQKDITSTDMQGPFSTDQDKDRAAKISARIASDAYFLGNVESVTKDATSQKVTVVVTANLFNTDTGESIRSFGVSGAAVPGTPGDTPAQVLQLAVDNAAAQVASSINSIPVVQDTTKKRHAESHRSGGANVVLLLLAGAVVYAATHHGNSDSSSSSTGTGGGGGNGGPPNPPSVP